jgi:hypothetical protein
MPVESTQRTLAQIAKLEKDDVLAKIAAASLPTTTASSNRSRVNNTDAASMDSQGLAGAHELRDEPNQSFNANTFDVYEEYENDALGAVEAKKASGAGGAAAYPDERAFPTNAPSTTP